MSERLAAALRYVDRGWPVFPVNPSTKAPMTAHGFHDASRDPTTLRAWFGNGRALIAIPTGEITGIVALDIDLSESVDGGHSLEELGVAFAPETPMAHTPRGGAHCLFAHPNRFVKTIAGKLGRGLDIRGDGGSLTLPPGPGRYWDPHLNLDSVPLAPMPSWMVIPEPEAPPIPSSVRPIGRLSRYAEAALEGAVRRIVEAPAGSQQNTLNAQVYGIGRLAGGGVIPPDLALNSMLWAARRMASHDARRPWRAVDVERKVKTAFADGLRDPREVPDGR
jgi:hypothetical protein